MASKNTTVFYQNQIDICKRHFSAEQFGRLMYALFEFENGNEPQVDDDIAIAFEFMSLQKRIDREKYEEKCRKNRENGKLGGRPRKGEEKPKKANGFFKNPNDDDDDDDDEDEDDEMMINDDDDEEIQHSVSSGSFGEYQNVELTDEEYKELKATFERTNALINKVSRWLRGAKNEVPDHYGLCLKFAENEKWPRRKVIEPAELPEVTDPLGEEEQREKVAEMRAKLNGAFSVVGSG